MFIAGESFSSRWCNMRVPKVEVMVMNLKSKTYTLPHFMKEMKNLNSLNVTYNGLGRTDIENFHLLGCLSSLTRIRLEGVVIPPLIKSTLALVNLKKISFITCNMIFTFWQPTTRNHNFWPKLVEIEMHECKGLYVFPSILCNCVYLKKLSIKSCYYLGKLCDDFGKLTSLETLILRDFTELIELPESITKLQNLSILDISGCLKLVKLPEQMGNLGCLRKIFMNYHTSMKQESTEDLPNLEVIYAKSYTDTLVNMAAALFLEA
ncbi:putative leucine-rich repeat domain superfamily [Helianthus debilis subsp. tardiflorus]